MTATLLIISTANALTGESRVIFHAPFIPNTYSYYSEIMLLLQFIFPALSIPFIVFNDSGMVFFGFGIIAACDILFDYISLNKEKIQENSNFLKMFIVRYCDVIDNVNQFNDIMSISLLIQFLSSGIIIFGIFFLIRLNPTTPDGYIMASAALIQSFLYCFFGEFITIKMERLATALYSTNWYDLNVKDRKSFLIVLGVTQKDYGMKAAGVYNVNIYTYVQVIIRKFDYFGFI